MKKVLFNQEIPRYKHGFRIVKQLWICTNDGVTINLENWRTINTFHWAISTLVFARFPYRFPFIHLSGLKTS